MRRFLKSGQNGVLRYLVLLFQRCFAERFDIPCDVTTRDTRARACLGSTFPVGLRCLPGSFDTRSGETIMSNSASAQALLCRSGLYGHKKYSGL